MLPAGCRQLQAGSLCSPETDRRALATYSQANIQDGDQGEAYRKAGQHKLFSALQHFSEDGVRGQIDKSATNPAMDWFSQQNVAQPSSRSGWCLAE